MVGLKLKLSCNTIDSSNIDSSSSNIDNSSSNSCESLSDSKSDADFESSVDRHPGQQVGSAEGAAQDRHKILRGDNVLLLEQQSVAAPVMSGLQTEQMSVRVVQ